MRSINTQMPSGKSCLQFYTLFGLPFEYCVNFEFVSICIRVTRISFGVHTYRKWMGRENKRLKRQTYLHSVGQEKERNFMVLFLLNGNMLFSIFYRISSYLFMQLGKADLVFKNFSSYFKWLFTAYDIYELCYNKTDCSLERASHYRQHSINYIRHKYSLEPLPNWYLINSW